MSRARVATLAAVAATLAAAAPLGAQVSVEASALLGRAEHRVDAGAGLERAVGTTMGVGVRVRGLDGLVELDARALGGRLGAADGAPEDLTMGELSTVASLLAVPWLALQGTATVRAYDVTPAVQRWTQLGAGAELRLDLADGATRGIVRGTLLPQVAVSGLTPPDLGVATLAGIEHRWSRTTVGIEYALERYGFPSDPRLGQRREQLSSLTLRLAARW